MTCRVHCFVRSPFAGSNHLQSQITARRSELAALRCGILPEKPRSAEPLLGHRYRSQVDSKLPASSRQLLPDCIQRAFAQYNAGHIRHRTGLLWVVQPKLPPLRLPGTAQRAADLYKAGHIRDPADLLTPSDVDSREFGLAHLTCFVGMKRRGHVDHIRASRGHPPERVHPDYADNSALKHHHSDWLRGNTWACYSPPRVDNSQLDSRRSAAKFTHWCCDAAIAAPPSRTFVPLTT